MSNELEEMAKEFTRWVDAITSDDFRGDVDKVLFKQFFDQALRQVREKTILECAEVADHCEMSEKAIETLRCNPDAKKPYVGSQERNGYDWACSDIAQAIRKLGGGK